MQNEEFLSPNNASGLGAAILTRRISHSPIFKNVWRFTTKAKSKDYVVFVGEVSIQVREVLKNGRLRTVTTKDDFGCKIRSSQVLTQPLLHLNEDEVSSHEDTDRLSLPQTLLLCLEDARLCILTALNHGHALKLLTQCVPLPVCSTRLHDPGRFIAVDTQSRAFAVAAVEDTVVLYNVKHRSKASSLGKFHYDALVVDVDAIICAVDFLSPPDGDNDSVVLIIIGTRRGRLCAIVCSWSHFSPQLTKETLQFHFRRLGKEHGMPTVLAPLKHAGSFLLICERAVAIYQYGHDGSIQQISCSAVRYEDPKSLINQQPSYVATSRRMPLWSTWGRALQQSEGFLDLLYILREDGLLHYLSFSKVQGIISILGAGVVGHVGINVNVAIAIIDSHTSSREAIVVCGSRGDGGVFDIDLLMNTSQNPQPLSAGSNISVQLRRTDMISDWKPGTRLALVRDSRFTRPYDAPVRTSNHPPPSFSSRGKVFTTSGYLGDGAVSELRYGSKMRVTRETSLPDVRGIESIQYLSVPGNNNVFACSFPWQSTIVFGDSRPRIECEIATEPTLAIAVMPPNSFDHLNPSLSLVVHITPSIVQLFEVDHCNSLKPLLQFAVAFNFDKITVATVIPEQRTLVLGIQSSLTYAVSAKELAYESGQYSLLDVGMPFLVSSEPTSILKIDLRHPGDDYMDIDYSSDYSEHHNLYFAMGTASSTVEIFQFDDKKCWHPMWQSVPSVSHPINACESLALLSSSSNLKLLGGFRDGTLHVIEMERPNPNGSLEITHEAVFHMGLLPVKIAAQGDCRTAAFISCESNLYFLDFNNSTLTRPKICQVYFEDYEKFDSVQLSLDAVCQLGDGALHDRLLCVSDGKAYIGLMSLYLPELLPRHLPVKGLPKRVLYSNHLKAIIITTTAIELNWQAKKRCEISTISLHTVSDKSEYDRNCSNGKEYASMICSIACSPGEKINDIAEWFYTRENHKYHFLIATTTVRHHNGEGGGLKYLKISKNKTGQWNINTAHDSKESESVYAITQFGFDSLVYGCGLDLKVRQFDAANGRFNKPISHRLGSPAIFITATEPLINVTTAEHGFLIFKVEGQHFELVFSENQARAGMCHLQLNHNQSFLVSDRGGYIVNMAASNGDTEQVAVPAWLKAQLPCSVTSLIKADVKPPWSQQAPGISEDGILGIATDGSSFSFSLLAEPAWKLLSMIQDLCHRDTRLSSHCLPASTSLGMGVQTTANFHVDGDILVRLLAMPNAAEILKSLLNGDMETPRLPYRCSGDLANQRFGICKEQLSILNSYPVFTDPQEINRPETETQIDEVVKKVLIFLELVLDVPL